MAALPEIVVEIDSEVLRGASKCDAIEAIEELIWNSLDADATRVNIEYQFSALGALEFLRVRDNGIGFEVGPKEAFGCFGSSLKKLRDRTPAGRIQHGREGRGRYKALALGSAATWSSVAGHLDGKFIQTTIRVDSKSPNRLAPSQAILDIGSTGVIVEVHDPTEAAASLLADDLSAELAFRFAPYLIAYPGIELWVNNDLVDPAAGLSDKRDESVSVEVDRVTYTATILLCVWKKLDREGRPFARVYYCTRDGFAVEEHAGYVQRLGVSMTAYVKSDYFEASDSATSYSRMGDLDTVAKGFLGRARELMRKVNREKLHERAREEVERLKTEKLYPFEGEPKDEVDRAERQVFDIVAEQLHVLAPDLAQDKAPDRKRKMEALKVAITTDPLIQNFLVEQVLGLTATQQKDFYEVLQKVPLANVVGMAKTVIDRLHFLSGLKFILFEPEVKKVLRERTQLHRILAEHLWLFGEEYHLGADDISLKNVLLRHRDILGLDDSAFELQKDVARTLGDVPDLMLYKTICLRPGHLEHLVIELKAPRVVCGEDEFAQIERYARTVANCDEFDKSRTRWRFVLVNTSFNEQLYASKALQRDRPAGVVLDHENYQVWALPWSQVIQDAEGRHQFLKERLDYQIRSDAPGLEYLKENFSEYLPESLMDGESDVEPAEEPLPEPPKT